MSQQPRALYYIKLMKLYFAMSEHFSVSPALGYTQLRSPVNVSQLPTYESFARGFRPVWHHHPLELANWPTNYKVFLLGVMEYRTWPPQGMLQKPIETPGQVDRPFIPALSNRGSQEAALKPYWALRNVWFSTQRLSSKWNQLPKLKILEKFL